MKVDAETAQVMTEITAKYRQDPVFFVEHALGHVTWSKQREVLQSVRDNERTAVRASHGVFKTYTAAEVAVWFLNCFPTTRRSSPRPRPGRR